MLTVYFDHHYDAYFKSGERRFVVSQGVVHVLLPEPEYTFSDFTDLACAGWFITAADIPPFTQGLLFIRQYREIVFVSPVLLTVLPRAAVRQRWNFSFEFTSYGPDVQAAFDAYGPLGLAALKRNLGHAPLAKFDSEGGLN